MRRTLCVFCCQLCQAIKRMTTQPLNEFLLKQLYEEEVLSDIPSVSKGKLSCHYKS